MVLDEKELYTCEAPVGGRLNCHARLRLEVA